jgi:hypothetical protein
MAKDVAVMGRFENRLSIQYITSLSPSVTSTYVCSSRIVVSLCNTYNLNVVTQTQSESPILRCSAVASSKVMQMGTLGDLTAEPLLTLSSF